MRMHSGPGLALAAIVAAAPAAGQASFRTEPAPDWDAFYDRHFGWTGADGCYSIPLSGVHSPGTGDLAPTVFTYGDTFVGRIDPKTGERLPGSTIVNNTFSGYFPAADRMRFLVRRDEQGQPRAVFIPNTPNSQPGEWYWPADGFVNLERDGDLTIFHFRLRGPGFHGVGTSLVIIPRDAANPIEEHRQVELPLFFPGDDERKPRSFGTGVIVNTEWAGAPNPDGYLYVYGHEERAAKRFLVCRTRPADIEDPTAWRFWNGSEWVEEITQARGLFNAVTGGITAENLPDGRVIAMYADFGGNIMARIGESPSGPFGPAFRLYRTPEVDLDPDVYTYNPIPHPHLSRPGELLVVYSVNSFEFLDLFEHADWFRPRFFRVILEDR